jgi:hypothetical protein
VLEHLLGAYNALGSTPAPKPKEPKRKANDKNSEHIVVFLWIKRNTYKMTCRVPGTTGKIQ